MLFMCLKKGVEDLTKKYASAKNYEDNLKELWRNWKLKNITGTMIDMVLG